jgi:ligand-binding sensor domain-containing protein
MSRRRILAGLAVLVVSAAIGVFLTLRSEVERALAGRVSDARPLQLVPLAPPGRPLDTWAGPEVEAVAFPSGELVTAGASGVWHARRGDLTRGLPSRRATALASWAGDLVVALEAGGLAVERGGAWHELRSGWGVLHARALVEAPGGELLVGAREGLFRAALGASAIERLDSHPVRALAIAAGFVVAGGEQGLFRLRSGRATPVRTPDPWIESVAVAGDTLFVVTAAGLARGPREGPLEPVRGGETIVQATWHDGRLWAVADPPANALRVLEADGSVRDELLPCAVRRAVSASGLLFADTAEGLARRNPDGWQPVAAQRAALPPGSAHVTALARFRGRLFVGLFDGGLAVAEANGSELAWRAVPGTAAWGINALLVAGGELWVASLRGATRFDGETMRPVEGPGAAFSLAATRDGVAIGYGQGVLLPGSTLLSAFHGLPGNQALALVDADALYVGTPSGLGALAGRRVLWRVTAGEGKLSHPWVSALLAQEDGLLVGTWGGGLVQRHAGGRASAAASGEGGRWEAFPETRGLAVSPGALASVEGRAWAGTDADGLWRQSRDRARFERVRAALPSARVTALLAEPGVLWVGTDQGVVRLPIEAAE